MILIEYKKIALCKRFKQFIEFINPQKVIQAWKSIKIYHILADSNIVDLGGIYER